jgi:hypothetical protein
MSSGDEFVSKGYERLVDRLIEGTLRMEKRSPDLVDALRILEDLSYDERRDVVASSLANVLTPSEPDIRIWLSWLSGGSAPREFDVPRFSSGPQGQSSMRRPVTRALERSGNFLEEADKLDREADNMKARAAELRAESDGLAQFARAYIARSIMAKLAHANQTRFAMGPAWVVLQAVMNHPQRLDMYRVMEALIDDSSFEYRLGEAVANVCLEFESKAAEKGPAWTTKKEDEEREKEVNAYIAGRIRETFERARGADPRAEPKAATPATGRTIEDEPYDPWENLADKDTPF